MGTASSSETSVNSPQHGIVTKEWKMSLATNRHDKGIFDFSLF
jgi:hypothetical protein